MRGLSSRFTIAITAAALASLAGCVAEPTAPASDPTAIPAAVAGAQQATQQVVASGTGWQIVHLSGVATADDGTARMVDQDLLVADSAAALEGAPISKLARGQIDGMISTLPASDRQGQIVVNMDAVRQAEGQITPQLLGCESVERTWRRSLVRRTSYSHSQANVAGVFQGTFTLSGSAKDSVGAAVTMRVYRTYVPFAGCIPFFSTLRAVRLGGGADLTGRAIVNANFYGEWHASRTVVSPVLFDAIVLIGDLPVWLTVEIPIEVGIDAGGRVKVDVDASAEAHGRFDVTCKSGTCVPTKSANWSAKNNKTPSFDASGRVSPWAQVSAKLSLYKGVSSGKVGVRATFKNHLWAYAGNSCGDGNGDGINEWVQAKTVDARLGLELRTSVAFFGVAAGEWSARIGDDYFIGFYDLIGSTAMDPIFIPTTGVGTTYAFRGRMRPCWPYPDPVTYRFAWGDGSPNSFLLFPPMALFTMQHGFPKRGVTYPVTLTATKDGAGRMLNRSATRSITIPTI